MKIYRLFSGLLIIMSLTACPNPTGDNDPDNPPATAKTVYNVSKGTSDYSTGFSDAVSYGSRMYFCGNNGITDKIYGFNGTQIVNVTVHDDCNYAGGFRFPIVYNGRLYFQGRNSSNQDTLYVYNGTSITNFTPAAGSVTTYDHGFQSPIIYNSMLYFCGVSTQGMPYAIDTNNKIMEPDNSFSYYEWGFSRPFVSPTQNMLFFEGRYNSAGSMLCAVTQENKIVTIAAADGSDYSGGFADPVELNEMIFFLGKDGLDTFRLYMYEGGDIKELDPGTSGYTNNAVSDTADRTYPIVYNNRVYVKGYVGSQPKIYRAYDSGISSLQAEMSCNYNNGFSNGIVYNGKLNFEGYPTGDTTHTRWYVFDGNSIKNAAYTNAADDFADLFFANPVVFDSRLYFGGSSTSNTKVYEFDGTTVRSLSVSSTDYDRWFGYSFVWNNTLFFEGSGSDNTEKIYMIR